MGSVQLFVRSLQDGNRLRKCTCLNFLRFWKLNNSIGVYKVVKEALKKSEKIHVVFFQVIVNTHEVVAKSKRVRYKRLSIIGEITHILQYTGSEFFGW